MDVWSLARRVVLAVLVLGIGLIHLLDLQGKWEETRWMGVGYLGLIATTVLCAELLLRRDGLLPLGLSAGIAVGPLVGFVLTRTTGLPGATGDVGNWLEPLGLASLFVEAVTLIVLGAAVVAHVGRIPKSLGVPVVAQMPSQRAARNTVEEAVAQRVD